MIKVECLYRCLDRDVVKVDCLRWLGLVSRTSSHPVVNEPGEEQKDDSGVY